MLYDVMSCRRHRNNMLYDVMSCRRHRNNMLYDVMSCRRHRNNMLYDVMSCRRHRNNIISYLSANKNRGLEQVYPGFSVVYGDLNHGLNHY